MSVRSFLVYVAPDAKDAVVGVLRALPICEVYPAENRDVVVVVSEVAGRAEEDAFDEHLAAIPGVLTVALVAGYTEGEVQR